MQFCIRHRRPPASGTAAPFSIERKSYLFSYRRIGFVPAGDNPVPESDNCRKVIGPLPGVYRMVRMRFSPSITLQRYEKSRAKCKLVCDFAETEYLRRSQSTHKPRAKANIFAILPVYSIAQRSAGRSLGAAEARCSRPAGPLRARPPQAAARKRISIGCSDSFLILPFSF